MVSNSWILLGLIAAVFWGIYVVVLKFALNPKYLNTPWPLGMLGFSLGVILVSMSILFLSKETMNANVFSRAGFWVSAAAGILWSLGASAVLSALSNPETDASSLVVVFNLNTIIAVLATIVLFREIPAAEKRLEVIIGAILVVIGAFLASRGS